MFPAKPLWICVAALLVIDTLWLVQTSFSLVWQSFLPIFITICLLAALAWFYTKYRQEPGFSMLAIAMIYIILLTNNAAIYSYLITSMNLPLLDAEFANIDAGMHFDWTAYLGWVNDRPILGHALTWSYNSSMLQVFFLLLLLGFTQRKARLSEFLILYTVTMLVIVTLAGLMPAEGAYAFHKPSAEIFANLDGKAGMWHYKDFTGLRNGTLRIINISKLEGLVTFPSFHTALAIIMVYCTRGIRFIFPALIILNIMVIISTLSEGGHYLIDILVAMILTVCVILALRIMHKSSFKTNTLITPTT